MGVPMPIGTGLFKVLQRFIFFYNHSFSFSNLPLPNK